MHLLLVLQILDTEGVTRLMNGDTVTATTGLYSLVHPIHGRIYLLDTPGFDDTFTSDTDVLKNIAAFLSATYQKRAQLAGIIYMHRITDNRLAGSSLRNIKMFKELCGEDAYKHVVLCTSMWGNAEDHDTAVARERQLKEDDGFWGLMHARGSLIMRWDKDTASASAIIDRLLERRRKHGSAVLQIQRELVDEGRELSHTSAGQEVNRELTDAMKKWSEEIEALRTDHEEAMETRDRQLAERLEAQELELQDKLQKADKAQKALKINLEHLLREKTEEFEKKQKELQDELVKATALIANRETELIQLVDTQKKDKELYDEMREEYANEREKMDARDAKRSKDLEEMENSLRRQYEQEERNNQRREQELKAQIKQGKQWKQKVAASIPPLIGVGLLVVGLVTANPALVVSGGSLMASGIA